MPLLLRAQGLEKRYPGVQALAGVDLELAPGEVHAVVGENGAGKSTLMKVLSGATTPDGGTIELEGRVVTIPTPHAAHAVGIRMIHQELNLVPALSVAENIALGAEPSRWGVVDRRRQRAESAAVLERIGHPLPLDVPVERLPLASRQITEIAKALVARARLLIMDEPSAILADSELEGLFALVRQLASEGMAIVYISHRLEEIFRLASRVTVMRDGRTVHSGPLGELTQEEIVRLMVGRELAAGYPAAEGPPGELLLRVAGVSTGPVRDVSFELRRGEILSMVGLVGSGRTELARGIFGAAPVTAGRMELDGRSYAPRSPAEAIRAGVALLPEDRKRQGLILHDAVRPNITLPTLGRLTRAGVIDRGRERAAARTWVEALRVRTPSIEQPVRLLSGGTQQKVVVARWMLASARLLIFDEPTRGIDVGAKAEIYALLRELAGKGAAVIVISSDLPEALGMGDRVLVMREGRVSAILDRSEALPERVGALMMPAA